MATKEYGRAAEILELSKKTEIVTNSRFPIVNILRMMGNYPGLLSCEDDYSKEIMRDLKIYSR